MKRSAILALLAVMGTLFLSASTLAVPGTLWTRRYDGPGHFDDRAYDVAVSPNGTHVFVTGESRGASSVDYATIAYDDPTGARLWTSRLDGPTHRYDAAKALAVSPDDTRVCHGIGIDPDRW